MKYYSIRRSFFIGSYTIDVKETEILDNYLSFLDESGACDIVKELIENDARKGGRPSYNPYDMLAAIAYCFAYTKGSLREISDTMKYDLRVIYLLQGEAPTYKTVGNFINKYIKPKAYEIFSAITSHIFKVCKIDMETVYVDGTKFEANANKYKFVWKPITFHNKLSDKIRNLLGKYDLLSNVPSEGIINSSIIADSVLKMDKILKENESSKAIADDYQLICEYLTKSLEYERKEEICGPNRNSYYKTDYDATTMCLKDDYYAGLGSSMHAAYCTQLAVSKGIITSFIVTQSRTDIKDLIPLLEKHFKLYNEYPKNLCADAGYGSKENYKYLRNHNINSYVKHQSWEGNVSGRYPRRHRLNPENSEEIICLKGNVGKIDSTIKRHPRAANGVFFKIEGCDNCEFSAYCKQFMKNKNEPFKIFKVSLEYQKDIEENEENLLSPKGIEMRVNRSSQVEGVYGIIKQNHMYTRFRRRNMEPVTMEFMLVCLGHNIRKLLSYFAGTSKFEYWKAPKNLAPEIRKKPSAKRLQNRINKKKTVDPNGDAKKSYKR